MAPSLGNDQPLGLPIDGKLTVFRPTFVNSMNSASVQMASIIGNFTSSFAGAATLMAGDIDARLATGRVDQRPAVRTHNAREVRQSQRDPTGTEPQQVVTTYSAPASAFPGSNDPGYQLNDNWSYFVSDTTGGLTIESYAVNAGAPSTTPAPMAVSSRRAPKAATVAADMGAVGQKWSAVSTAAL